MEPNRCKNIIVTGATGIIESVLLALIPTLSSASAHKIILGSRSSFNTGHLESLIPVGVNIVIRCYRLDLMQWKSVRTFAEQVEREIGDSGIDTLILNAAVFGSAAASSSGWNGYCNEAVVNHFAQHYLTLLLRFHLAPMTEARRSRIVYITSAKYSSIPSLESLSSILRDGNATSMQRYAASKFVQLVAAFDLSRQGFEVVAISPGFVPTSGLSREASFLGRFFMKYIISLAPFATSLSSAGELISDILTLPSERLVSFRLDSTSSFVYFDKECSSLELDERVKRAGSEWTPTREEMESWTVES